MGLINNYYEMKSFVFPFIRINGNVKIDIPLKIYASLSSLSQDIYHGSYTGKWDIFGDIVNFDESQRQASDE